jgi:two-component system, OmpR family, sensor histidine kinase KdpD
VTMRSRDFTRHRAAVWVGWIAVLVAVTAGLLALRPHLNDAHVALAYLVVVLFGGARSGRAVGFALAGLAFGCFDWYFVPPYGTLSVGKSNDWIVLIAFLATSIVVTQLFERARHEADAARSARLRESIVASVSHDLRTPLTSIKALAHDLAANGDERAEVIEAEADRLAVLVSDLLDFSRVSSGSLPLTIEPNEAEDLLGAALQQVTGAAFGRAINVHLDPKHPLLFGSFDFTHTLRVVVNLVENALKYSRPETAVDLSVERDGPWLLFAVADRGPGVPDEEREKIFAPFYRPAGVAPDAKGVGLGLSIARALAEAQGSSLQYSPREGGGSVFTLRIPAIDVPDMSTG